MTHWFNWLKHFKKLYFKGSVKSTCWFSTAPPILKRVARCIVSTSQMAQVLSPEQDNNCLPSGDHAMPYTPPLWAGEPICGRNALLCIQTIKCYDTNNWGLRSFLFIHSLLSLIFINIVVLCEIVYYIIQNVSQLYVCSYDNKEGVHGPCTYSALRDIVGSSWQIVIIYSQIRGGRIKKNLYLSLQLRSGSIIEKDLPVEASRSKQAAVGAVANSLREPGVVLWNIMFVQNKYLDCNIRARVLDRLFVDQTISRFFFNSTVESLRCAHKRSDQSLYALYSHRRSLFNGG